MRPRKGKGPDPAKIQKLKSEARGSVSITSNSATDYVGFVRAGRNGDLLPQSQGASPAAKTNDFIAEYGDILGLEAGSGLVRTDTAIDRQGAVHLTLQAGLQGPARLRREREGSRRRAGRPDGRERHGRARRETSRPRRGSAPTRRPRGRSRLSRTTRSEREDGGLPAFGTAGDLRAASSELLVYRTGLDPRRCRDRPARYRVDVTNGADIREVVFVHANAGKVLNRYSLDPRRACTACSTRQSTANKVWEEGDPFPGALNVDQQNIVKFSEDSYNHFFNAFGRDSYDGAGAFMQSVNNDPRINCPNANWNGLTTNYCNGVTADDVVAHEWGHAYTEFTHNLIYQWQSGALNESYSDIWGELVDLINGEGTDSPGAGAFGRRLLDATRRRCRSSDQQPGGDRGHLRRGRRRVRAAAHRRGHDRRRRAGERRRAGVEQRRLHAAAERGSMTGKIALVDRGTCPFVVKVKNAQNAGAIGVVVADNVARAAGRDGGRRPDDHDPVAADHARPRQPDQGPALRSGRRSTSRSRPRRGNAGGLLPLAHGRGRDRLRRRDPRHVEPALPLRPGQGHGRRVPLRRQRRRRRAHELGRPEPRLRPARGRRHVQRPHGRRDRADEGRAHLLARAGGVPDAERATSTTMRTRSRRRAPT